ncbi:MAG TPA: 3-isopropylmalate dehydrogenase [Methylomirabilota bacterium]|nr:3-isopropylmalate dehydrogenase [Methylomirabilota bacterium]
MDTVRRPCVVIAMPGEGVGPEVTAVAVDVLRTLADLFDVPVTVQPVEVGEPAWRRTGRHLPADAEQACRAAEASGRGAILFGAVADEPIGTLRKQFDLFANLRPVRVWPALVEASPVRAEVARDVDLLIVRELVSGVYYGRRQAGTDAGGRWASQAMYYGESEIRRIARVAFEQARSRRRHLTLVHKANAIPGVYGLWQDVVGDVAAGYPDVAVETQLVDSMAAQLVLRPRTFDVILASNLFGDILSDLGGGLAGSIGLLPSASLNAKGFALYEPVGGTAPDIAGKNVANPLGAVLSVALLCRHTLGQPAAATLLERAVDTVLARHRTADVWRPGLTRVSTTEMGERLTAELRRAAGRPAAATGVPA